MLFIDFLSGFVIFVMFVVLWFFWRNPLEPLNVKKPGLTFILSIVAWVLMMGLNNYLLYKGMSDNYRRIIELVIPPLIVLLFVKDRLKSLGFRKKWSNLDRAWLIPSSVFFIAWLLSKPAVTTDNFVLIAQIIFFAGIGQEVYYRGFMQPRAEIVLGGRWGLVCASMLFAIYHPISKIVVQGFDIKYLGFLIVFGLMTGFSFRRSRNILPLVLFHSVYDVFRMVH